MSESQRTIFEFDYVVKRSVGDGPAPHVVEADPRAHGAVAERTSRSSLTRGRAATRPLRSLTHRRVGSARRYRNR